MTDEQLSNLIQNLYAHFIPMNQKNTNQLTETTIRLSSDDAKTLYELMDDYEVKLGIIFIDVGSFVCYLLKKIDQYFLEVDAEVEKQLECHQSIKTIREPLKLV